MIIVPVAHARGLGFLPLANGHDVRAPMKQRVQRLAWFGPCRARQQQ